MLLSPLRLRLLGKLRDQADSAAGLARALRLPRQHVLLGKLAADPETVRDRFSSTYLVAAASRLVRDVTLLRRRADRAGNTLRQRWSQALAEVFAMPATSGSGDSWTPSSGAKR